MRRQEQKEYTKNILTESAIHLFKQHGFQNTTVQQITDHAGVAKGTFFNYFPSKESVLHSIGTSQVKLLETFYSENIDKNTSAQELIEKLFEELAVKNEEYGPNLILSTFQIWVSQIQFQEEESIQVLRFKEILTELISKGQTQGVFKTSVNSQAFARVVINSYFGTLLYWIRHYPSTSLQSLMTEMVDSLMDGLRV